MADRVLGVVGGIGPESTLDYYRRLVDGWHQRAGTGSHPRILIDSIESGALIGPMVAGDVAPIRDAVAAAVEQLAAAGAGLAIIASVAVHTVFEDVARTAPVPMLSIVDATCRAAQRTGVRRPVVLGTRVAVGGRFFAAPFEAAGITLVRADRTELDWVHEVYMGELVAGVFRDETRQRLLAIVRRLRDTQGADSLILAGTELSLILPESSYEAMPVFNAAAIHVEEALDWLAGTD